MNEDKTYFKQHLHLCLQREVMKSDKPFAWRRVWQAYRHFPERRFYFWWRLASYWYNTGSPAKRNRALRINEKLRARYGLDIKLGAHIGAGLRVSHYVGIVISQRSVIGENLHIKQNVTIGVKSLKQKGGVHIGDNVDIGANSCIIGDDLHIGNNVTIGAMSFINKSIPDHCTVYNKRETTITYEKSNQLPLTD